jgi:ribosomal protein S15P/S13E
MYLTKEIKEEIFAHTEEKTNTGKQKVKCFFRITHLTEHLEKSSRL